MCSHALIISATLLVQVILMGRVCVGRGGGGCTEVVISTLSFCTSTMIWTSLLVDAYTYYDYFFGTSAYFLGKCY